MRKVSKYPRRNAPHFGTESDGLQAGDGIGNRQKFSETRISADDIGNRISPSELNEVVRDDIGNSVGGAATHMQSGILASLDGRRRRREGGPDARNAGGYLVGGVNPVVSGNHALVSMYAESQAEEESAEPEARIEPRGPVRVITERPDSEARRLPRKNDKGSDSSDRWLKRLLEFEDDERTETPSTGDPKLKATQARTVLSEIFEKAGVMAAIGTQILADSETGRSSVVVSFEDIDVSVEPSGRLSTVFAENSLSLLALNFLVNKIVNRVPEERVKVTVALRK
jgi:hypothetical protein